MHCLLRAWPCCCTLGQRQVRLSIVVGLLQCRFTLHALLASRMFLLLYAGPAASTYRPVNRGGAQPARSGPLVNHSGDGA
jgi:hypothetical protein